MYIRPHIQLGNPWNLYKDIKLLMYDVLNVFGVLNNMFKIQAYVVIIHYEDTRFEADYCFYKRNVICKCTIECPRCEHQ